MIQINDHVDITFAASTRGGSTLIDYVVLAIPGNNEIYWTLAPADKLTEITVIGPSFLSIVLRP